MNVQANNNGGATGGNRKYPNELGYVADQGIDHFDRQEFREIPVDKIFRYNQRHASLARSDFTAYAFAMMTPVDELLEMMRQVDREAPNLRPNRFHPNDTPIQLEASRYGTLVVERHEKQRNRYLDDLSLQVSDAVMATSEPDETLTKFIRRIEARVFAEMQSAPPQEMNDDYGLPADGRPDNV